MGCHEIDCLPTSYFNYHVINYLMKNFMICSFSFDFDFIKPGDLAVLKALEVEVRLQGTVFCYT
jgi:hypothetical protein